MFIRIVIATALALIGSAIVFAEFPAEEVWSVEFDTTVTCLGPNWEEEGNSYFLVGLENQAVIVREGDIAWESPELGTEELPEIVTAVSRIDFGVEDGAELIVSTVQSWYQGEGQIEADTGKVYLFSGDGYEDMVVRGTFLREMEGPDAKSDTREVRSIHTFSDMLPDTSKRIITCNTDYQRFPHGVGFTRSGSINVSDGERGHYGHGRIGFPVVSHIYNDGEEEHLILASFYSHWIDNLREYPFDYVKRSMIHTFDSELQLANTRILGSFDTELYHFREPDGRCDMYGMAIFDDAEGEPNLYVAYSDTVPRPRLARLSFDNLETEDEMFLPFGNESDIEVNIHHFPWGDLEQGENMIVCITSDGRIVAVDPVEMVETERGAFRMDCIGVDVGNYDDDEQLELVYLSDDALYLSDVTPLSTSTPRHPYTPTTYTIQSAYPHPFNSKTMVEYTLPRAGRYALVVYDVNGAEITRLADEWGTVGEHRTVWNAAGAVSGTYFVKLGVEGQFVAEAVQLIK